jgi:chromosome segregation ATPase
MGEFDQLKNDFEDGTLSLRTDLTTTQEKVVTVRNDLSATQSHVVTLDAQLGGASRDLQQVRSDLGKLDTRVKAIEDSGAPGAPELDPVYAKINEVEKTLSAADEAIRGDLTKITVTLGENTKQLADHRNTLDGHTRVLAEQIKRLGLAETNIESLEVAKDITVSEIGILKTHAVKVVEVLEQTERRVDLLEAEVENIKNNL